MTCWTTLNLREAIEFDILSTYIIKHIYNNLFIFFFLFYNLDLAYT